MPLVDEYGHMVHLPGRELFDSGTNRFGVDFKIHQIGRIAVAQYVLEMEYRTSEVYKDGCIVLDVAHNTRFVRRVEREG